MRAGIAEAGSLALATGTRGLSLLTALISTA